MEGHLVRVLIIDTLDNIDFTRRGPVRTNGPETRPRRTADRHVGGINDKETAVVALLRCDANTARLNEADKLMNTVFTHESRLPPAATVLVESTARTVELSQSSTYARPLDCASDLLW